ncbi:MAG: PAS domain-containing protein, partial [Sphingomonadales bacterium]|nr:PAS domain-containing protein [Sphingomonadales bacterium]
MSNQYQRSEGSLALEAYWESIRPDGQIPGREDLKPADIPTLLPNILLMEVRPDPERKLLVRLAGTYLRDLWKVEPTGLDYLSFVPDAEKDEVYNGFIKACAQPCGRWRQVISNFAGGGSVRVESTYFPLINNKSDHPLV